MHPESRIHDESLLKVHSNKFDGNWIETFLLNDDQRLFSLFARLSALAFTLCLAGCVGGYTDARFEDEAIDLGDARRDDRERDDRDAAPATDAGADAALPALTHDLLSNEAVVQLLEGHKYRGAGFRQVNARPFPSTVSPDKTISLFVSEVGYDAYTKVAPDRAGSRVEVPVGTVIVREVLKESVLDTITVMMRLPKGAFPLGGDWWYCSASPDGKIRNNADDGTPIIGLLEDCGTCHLRRNNDDYLFGAPREYLR